MSRENIEFFSPVPSEEKFGYKTKSSFVKLKEQDPEKKSDTHDAETSSKKTAGCLSSKKPGDKQKDKQRRVSFNQPRYTTTPEESSICDYEPAPPCHHSEHQQNSTASSADDDNTHRRYRKSWTDGKDSGEYSSRSDSRSQSSPYDSETNSGSESSGSSTMRQSLPMLRFQNQMPPMFNPMCFTPHPPPPKTVFVCCGQNVNDLEREHQGNQWCSRVQRPTSQKKVSVSTNTIEMTNVCIQAALSDIKERKPSPRRMPKQPDTKKKNEEAAPKELNFLKDICDNSFESPRKDCKQLTPSAQITKVSPRPSTPRKLSAMEKSKKLTRLFEESLKQERKALLAEPDTRDPNYYETIGKACQLSKKIEEALKDEQKKNNSPHQAPKFDPKDLEERSRSVASPLMRKNNEQDRSNPATPRQSIAQSIRERLAKKENALRNNNISFKTCKTPELTVKSENKRIGGQEGVWGDDELHADVQNQQTTHRPATAQGISRQENEIKQCWAAKAPGMPSVKTNNREVIDEKQAITEQLSKLICSKSSTHFDEKSERSSGSSTRELEKLGKEISMLVKILSKLDLKKLKKEIKVKINEKAQRRLSDTSKLSRTPVTVENYDGYISDPPPEMDNCRWGRPRRRSVTAAVKDWRFKHREDLISTLLGHQVPNAPLTPKRKVKRRRKKTKSNFVPPPAPPSPVARRPLSRKKKMAECEERRFRSAAQQELISDLLMCFRSHGRRKVQANELYKVVKACNIKTDMSIHDAEDIVCKWNRGRNIDQEEFVFAVQNPQEYIKYLRDEEKLKRTLNKWESDSSSCSTAAAKKFSAQSKTSKRRSGEGVPIPSAGPCAYNTYRSRPYQQLGTYGVGSAPAMESHQTRLKERQTSAYAYNKAANSSNESSATEKMRIALNQPHRPVNLSNTGSVRERQKQYMSTRFKKVPHYDNRNLSTPSPASSGNKQKSYPKSQSRRTSLEQKMPFYQSCDLSSDSQTSLDSSKRNDLSMKKWVR